MPALSDIGALFKKGKKERELSIKKGHVYYFKKKTKWQGLELINGSAPPETENLFITSKHQAEIPKKISLSQFKAVNYGPDNLDEVITKTKDFFLDNPGCIVLLDDYESVSSGVNSKKALSLLSKIVSDAMSSGSTLIVSLSEVESEYSGEIERVLATSCLEAILEAFSNPIRREILGYLNKNGSASFTALMDELGFANIPPKLSFHLNVLKESKVVCQDAKKIYYLTDYGKTLIELSNGFEKMVLECCLNLEKSDIE